MKITDEMTEAAARAALDEGWTCTAHEPFRWGECSTCTTGLTTLAEAALSAALAVAPTVVSDEEVEAGHRALVNVRAYPWGPETVRAVLGAAARAREEQR